MARIQNQVNRVIPDVQAGFRAGCGTRDQIVNLRLITEKAREFGQPLFMCFIDYKKALNMGSHNQLWINMIDMGFPLHIIDLIRSLYRKQQSAVRSAAGMMEWFKIGRGVRQGCILHLGNNVKRLNLKKGDYDSFSMYMAGNWDEEFSDCGTDVDKMWCVFKDRLV